MNKNDIKPEPAAARPDGLKSYCILYEKNMLVLRAKSLEDAKRIFRREHVGTIEKIMEIPSKGSKQSV